MIECSGFYAAWPKASWLNAEDSMHCGAMDPDCMQWSPCSVMNAWIPCSLVKCIQIECSGFHAAWRNGTLLNAVDSTQHDWVQWIPWSMIECSGFYAAWPKASRLNAVDSMHCDWMRCNLCSVVKCIPIKCSGFHPAWLNAVDSMQRGPCIPSECSGFYSAWPKAPRLNAVDSMQLHWMQWIPCIVIECSVIHAAW